MTLAQYSASPTMPPLPPGAIAAFATIWLFCLAIGLVVYAFTIYCWYRVAGKAGFSPWLGLIALIPLGSLILLLIFAFSDWPALRGGPGLYAPVGTSDASSGYLAGQSSGPISPT
jgi:hypothetical protein